MQIARPWYSAAIDLLLLAGVCLFSGCGEPAAPPGTSGAADRVAANNASRPAPPRPRAPDPNASDDGRNDDAGNDPYADRDDSDLDDSGRSDRPEDGDLTTDSDLTSVADADDTADGRASTTPPEEVAYDEFGRPIPGGSGDDAGSRRDRDDVSRGDGDLTTAGDSASAPTQPDRPPPETATEAIAALEEIGGRVQLEGDNAVRVFLNRTAATDWHMRAVALLREVKVLNISHTRVTDAGLEHLRALAKLERIYPHGTAVTDAGVEGLGKALPNLQILR